MPRGIYIRTPAIREAIRRARFGTRLLPETKAKISVKARANAADSDWRRKVSEGTEKALNSPTIRRKFLKGFRKFHKEHGSNFDGGNGRKPVHFVLELEKILAPFGWVREFAIGIPNAKSLGAPRNYKVDFAHVQGKVVIECDGPCHRKKNRQILDAKKTRILKSFGWRVIRVKH